MLTGGRNAGFTVQYKKELNCELERRGRKCPLFGCAKVGARILPVSDERGDSKGQLGTLSALHSGVKRFHLLLWVKLSFSLFSVLGVEE